MRLVHANFARGFRGGERQTLLLIEALARRGYAQRLLVRPGSELGARAKAIAGLEIIEISKPYALHVSHVRGFDCIHAHETKALQFAFFAKLFLGVPYIVTRRVDNPISPNAFNRALYTHAARCVALSSAIELQIITLAPKARVLRIPSAYSGFTCKAQNVQAIKARFEGKFLIGHIGALDDAHKGQSTLIEAMRLLTPKYPQMQLLLLGRGADEAMLRQRAEGLPCIHFEGFVENVGDYIGAFDLFAFPSNNEGLGSTLLDVMDGEVAIVASRVGGIVDLIEHEHSGLLVKPRDATALAEAIERLYQNADERAALAKAAKKGLDAFSVEAMTQAYVRLYGDVIDLSR
ncbi:MAG: glycosyltransferase family 4 protein [Campylobacterales bacterium]|nr:glycosyltransferase family 4 protein [Campylobacterales bacterium]